MVNSVFRRPIVKGERVRRHLRKNHLADPALEEWDFASKWESGSVFHSFEVQGKKVGRKKQENRQQKSDEGN